jgi:hypothetical protein
MRGMSSRGRSGQTFAERDGWLSMDHFPGRSATPLALIGERRTSNRPAAGGEGPAFGCLTTGAT